MATTNIFLLFYFIAGSQGGCVLSVINQHPLPRSLLTGESINHSRVLDLVYFQCHYW